MRKRTIAEQALRRDIARDLHDGVGQLLALALMKLDTGASAQARDYVKLAIEEVRRIAEDLRPEAVERLGFLEALRAACRLVADAFQMPVGFRGPRIWPSACAGVEVALYRVAQEALSNAAKHSRCERIDVRLRVRSGTARLTVSDDGRGLGAQRRSGRGLKNMRARIEALGGSFRLRTARGRGTVVEAGLRLTPLKRPS